jgi:hypothetical protein
VEINLTLTDSVRTLCLSCDVKYSKTTAKLSEAKTSVVVIVFNGGFYHVRPYTITVSYLQTI